MAVWIQIIGFRKSDSIENEKKRISEILNKAEFDFDLASRAIMLSSANQISITKLDVRFPECAGAQSIDQLDSNSTSFIKNIEEKLGVPVTLIGTGPGVNDVIDLRT